MGLLLAKVSMAALLFEAITGLAITFAPFHAAVQWSAAVPPPPNSAIVIV